jgi:hypothetical protein
MIVALLGMSLAGAAWLRHTTRHTVDELLAATATLAPLMTLLVMGVAR